MVGSLVEAFRVLNLFFNPLLSYLTGEKGFSNPMNDVQLEFRYHLRE